MGGLIDELMEHEIDVILGTAHRLQSWAAPSDVAKVQNKQPCDDPCTAVADEILRSTIDLPPPKVKDSLHEHKGVCYVGNMCMQVQTFLRTDTEYLKRPAFAFKLERIPGMSSELRERMKCFINRDSSLGTTNSSRKLNPLELTEKGKVRFDLCH